jgi:tetratricopeptide (TPR) repeat protein
VSEQTHTPPETPRRAWLLPALLVTITMAVFAPVCHMVFVDWDDPLHTYQNPYLQTLTWPNLAHLWRGVYEGEYVPVTYMVFAFLSVFGQHRTPAPTPSGGFSVLNPHAFHTANLVLHLVNTLLVFALLRRLVKHEIGAFFGALLFAVHPVQVESVAWISELRGLLSGTLGLLSLHLYLDFALASQAGAPGRRRAYISALVLFVLAVLAKPSAVALPVMALALDWAVVRRPLRQSLKAIAVWGLAALPIIGLTRGAQPVPADLQLPLWQRPLIAGDAIAFYLSKLLLPLHLGADYGRTPASVLHGGATACLGLIVVLLLAALAWRWRVRQPWLPVAFGLFLAALLPVLGFVPFVFQKFSTVADRYLYLALLGPALLVAASLAQARHPLRAAVPFDAFLALCFVLTHAQVGVWRDSWTLFTHAVAVNPRSAQMRYNLGNVYQYHGQTAAAITQYRDAVRLWPGYAQAHCNLGEALSDSGQRAAAVAEFREAVRLKPDLATGHLCLGIQLADAGDTPGALSEWQQAVTFAPENPLARYNLACALFSQKRSAEAADQFREVLRLQPDYGPALQALRLLTHKKA